MHYQEKIDSLYQGSLVPNRTLRTLFDCLSSEWDRTTFEKKEEMLMKMYLSDQPISFYVKGYQKFYSEEISNKAHVLDSLSKSIRQLVMNVKDELLRASLLKIYIDLSKEEER